MKLNEPEVLPAVPASRRQADLARIRMAIAMSEPVRSDRGGRAGRKWGRRGVTLAVAGVMAAGGAATAAAAIVRHLDPENATVTTHGRCYWEASSDYGDDFPGTTAANATDTDGWTPSLVRTLLDDCAAT